MHLRHVVPGFGASHDRAMRKTHVVELRHRLAAAPVGRCGSREHFGVAARVDPALAYRAQAAANIVERRGVRVRTTGIVYRVRRSVGERDFAHRYPNRGVAALDVDFHGSSLRRHYPDQVLAVGVVPSQPVVRAPAARTLRRVARDCP